MNNLGDTLDGLAGEQEIAQEAKRKRSEETKDPRPFKVPSIDGVDESHIDTPVYTEALRNSFNSGHMEPRMQFEDARGIDFERVETDVVARELTVNAELFGIGSTGWKPNPTTSTVYIPLRTTVSYHPSDDPARKAMVFSYNNLMDPCNSPIYGQDYTSVEVLDFSHSWTIRILDSKVDLHFLVRVERDLIPLLIHDFYLNQPNVQDLFHYYMPRLLDSLPGMIETLRKNTDDRVYYVTEKVEEGHFYLEELRWLDQRVLDFELLPFSAEGSPPETYNIGGPMALSFVGRPGLYE